MKSSQDGTKSAPIGRSYWVIPGKFLAGCYPGSQDKKKAHTMQEAILAHGIRHFVNLMEVDEVNKSGKPFAPYQDYLNVIAPAMGIDNLTFARMPIKDLWIPSEDEMCQILDHIDRKISEGRSVYVHCWGGRGRTGTVVGCYLARHGFALGRKLLHLLDDLRRHAEDHSEPSPETQHQIDMVLSWSMGK